MINTSSFKSYGKVSETDQARLEARRRSRKRITIISLSLIVLATIVVAAGVGTRGDTKNGDGDQTKSISTSVKAVCDVTLYKDSCYSSLGSEANSTQIRPEDLFLLSIKVAQNELSKASKYFYNEATFGGNKDNTTLAALNNCRDLLSVAMDHLDGSLSSGEGSGVLQAVDDLKTWLSTAGTCLQTCIDSFEEENNGTVKASIQHYLKSPTELTSNSLAIITWISKITNSLKLRRLMSVVDDYNKEPKWLITSKDRKIIEISSSRLKMSADAVVAKDGSAKYKAIGAAIKAVPEKSKKRFVIYVKKGVYNETVKIEKSKWNVLMIGDGMNATIVSGSLNFVDGTPTFSTATFSVFGKGFIARDMGFHNTAGPSKHQAVALMSNSDMSIFFNCSFDAFQDTLYAHSNRQFYRQCNIYGTVDFIFGNAAVVFQNCNILPKRPMPGQQNTITAQGKVDPNQNTGISIQNCTILPSRDLTGIKTFLGRPWKNYSTTIYIQSMMGSLIDPTGWLPWTGNSAPDTIFYAEFQNYGPGSSTKNRVKWKGLRSISSKEANTKFSVKAFLQGDKWISDSSIPYKPSV